MMQQLLMLLLLCCAIIFLLVANYSVFQYISDAVLIGKIKTSLYYSSHYVILTFSFYVY